MTTQADDGPDGRPDSPTGGRADDEAVVRVEGAERRDAAGGLRLADISLTLWPGTFRLLVGSRGSGKAALMDLLAGTVPPDSGSVVLLGRDTSTLTRAGRAAAAQRVGRVYDDDRLFAHLSVFDNVALPLRIVGFGGRQVRRRVGDLLEWLGLGDAAAMLPASVPPVQHRLIAVARAVVTRPSLILAESPLRGLPSRSAAAVLFLLEEMARHGAAVLVAMEDGGGIRCDGPPLRLRDGRLVSGEAVTAAPDTRAAMATAENG